MWYGPASDMDERPGARWVDAAFVRGIAGTPILAGTHSGTVADAFILRYLAAM